jgi:hypothetical protein
VQHEGGKVFETETRCLETFWFFGSLTFCAIFHSLETTLRKNNLKESSKHCWWIHGIPTKAQNHFKSSSVARDQIYIFPRRKCLHNRRSEWFIKTSVWIILLPLESSPRHEHEFYETLMMAQSKSIRRKLLMSSSFSFKSSYKNILRSLNSDPELAKHLN